MIADSVAFLVGEGKRVIYDAEHFFDGWRDDPAYALQCLAAAAGAGAENVTICDTNGSSLPAQVMEATVAVRAALDPRGHAGHPCPQRRGVRRRQLPGRRRRGRGSRAGHDERGGGALRQREPRLDPAGAPAQARLPVRLRRAARDAHRGCALRRRALQPHAEPRPGLRGQERLRPQGRHARRRRARGRDHVRAPRPEPRRQQPRAAHLRALGQGHGPGARRRLGPRARRADGPRASSTASRSSSTRATTSRPPTRPSTCCCARRTGTTSRSSGWSPGA